MEGSGRKGGAGVGTVPRTLPLVTFLRDMLLGKRNLRFLKNGQLFEVCNTVGKTKKNIQNHATSTSQNLVKHIGFMFEIDSGHALRS